MGRRVVVHNPTTCALPVDAEGHQCFPGEWAIGDSDRVAGSRLVVIDLAQVNDSSDPVVKMLKQEVERQNGPPLLVETVVPEVEKPPASTGKRAAKKQGRS